MCSIDIYHADVKVQTSLYKKAKRHISQNLEVFLEGFRLKEGRSITTSQKREDWRKLQKSNKNACSTILLFVFIT